jgi:LCP family protein required for cell wall assembly
MMVLHFEGGEAKMLPIPRDLWVTRADNGQKGKINGSYNGGPPSLIKTITNADNLGVPVNHYMEVDFASFAGLVDGLGGITINFPHPAFDKNTGLNITQAGPQKLNGQQALAYVRSRHYVEVIDGQNKPDGTADLGRIQRQQQFLRAVFAKLDNSSNPFTLLRTASKVTGGLRIDDDMTLWSTFQFAMKLKGLEPKPIDLPVGGCGNALCLDEQKAEPVLTQFR